MQFEIKLATKKDTPIVLSFIKKLAQYEKLLHKVEATESLLESTLFGENPKAEVIIGYLDFQPVSFAIFFHNFSTFLGKPGIYLEDLFVEEHARGNGIGRKMLQHLAKIAKDRDCGRFEWWVLDWNKPAIDFYKSMGAKAMDEYTVYRVDGERLADLADN